MHWIFCDVEGIAKKVKIRSLGKLPDTLYIVLQYWVDTSSLYSIPKIPWIDRKVKLKRVNLSLTITDSTLHVTYFKSMHIVTTNEKNHANEMTLSFIPVHV